jgi:hypothetical protein
VPYVHTQNGMAKSLIKRIKLVTKLMFMRCNFPTSCWGYALLHVVELILLQSNASAYSYGSIEKTKDLCGV